MRATCYFCRTGQYNACPDVVFFSTPPYHGTLSRYHLHPEEWLHPLPDTLSFEEGSLLEPLSVALAGIDRSELRLGDPLVICGAGPIGLVVLLAAHAAGANPITVVDLDANRLEVAKRLIPRIQTVQVTMGEAPKEVAQKIKGALGCEARLVFECTGVESSVQSAVYVSISLPCGHDIVFTNHDSPVALVGWSSSSAVARNSRTSPSPICLLAKSICDFSTGIETHTRKQLVL